MRRPLTRLLFARLVLCAAACGGAWWLAAPRLTAEETQVPPKQIKVGDLQAKYPFVDVRARLRYEAARSQPATLTNETDQRLLEAEAGLDRRLVLRAGRTYGLLGPDKNWDDETRAYMRRHTLATLHEMDQEAFISAEGFGYSRMMPALRPSYLEQPTPAPIPFARRESSAKVQEEPRTAVLAGKAAAQAGEGLPSVDRLAAWHAQGELGFLNTGGFGITSENVRRAQKPEPQLVAGFESHRFRNMPDFVDHGPLGWPKARHTDPRLLTPEELAQTDQKAQPQAEAPREKWLVQRLELVSLLKHEQPAVYVSENLPRMDELAKARTRGLTAFETQALQKLNDGEDLAIQSSTNVIHMLGALRAKKQCQQCHQVERGALLGAFSYELLRDPPQPAAAPKPRT